MRSKTIYSLATIAGIMAMLGGLLTWGVQNVREAAARSHCNLGGVALALTNYKEEHGRFPPAILYDKDGKPLHSWRVLILPYLGEEELFKEFRLDEPWDSPHNIALLPRMPKSYAAPGHKADLLPAHHTILRVFVGKGTPFEEDEPFTLADPSWQRLLFVEAGEPVPWTQPEYLAYDPDRPLPDLRRIFRDGFRACYVDCSRAFIRKETPEAELRALIARGDSRTKD